MNPQSPEFNEIVFHNFLDTWVIPDITERIKRGELQNPYPFDTAVEQFQIVFSPSGPPKVRLNGEVRANVKAQPKPGLEIKIGEPLALDQIETSAGILIALKEDEIDCGHATFFRLPECGWRGSFDFIRYKGTARRHVDAAQQFLSVAKHCRNDRQWITFVDNLWSAQELTAKAALFYYDPRKEIVTSKKHRTISANFNRQRHIGNIAEPHTESFNRLWELRQKARYLEDDVEIADTEADELLRHVSALIESIQVKVKTL